MTKLQELIEKRAKAWEGAKAFVESKKDKDGLLSDEDVKTYHEMESKIQQFTDEIDRTTRMDAMERELSKPVNTPLTAKPMGDMKEREVKPSSVYKEAMLKALRSNFRQIDNVLQEKWMQMVDILYLKSMTIV